METPELVKWIRNQYGEGKRYKSARALSLAAGRHENTVITIEGRGRATPEVLRDIAAATGESPLRLFVMAGWLDESEFSTAVTDQERRFLDKLRRLPDFDRETLERVMEGLLSTSGDSNGQPAVSRTQLQNPVDQIPVPV